MSAQRFDPNNAQNLVEIEKQCLLSSFDPFQTYWNLLEKVPPRDLKLSKLDNEIYEHTMAAFPEFNSEGHKKLVQLDEDWLKSEDGKKRWREFISGYEKKVKDYNFGSLIRTDARLEYSETNTIFVTRMQFYAIEIARNRLGLNDRAHEIAKADAEMERLMKDKETSRSAKKNGNSMMSFVSGFVLALESCNHPTMDDVISIHSSEESGTEYVDRRAILEPVVRRVVDALGGYEDGVYRMGDEVNACLRDLKKLWRRDDTDDERTVARIFWDTRVLPNDLIPILLATAGKRMVEDKRAIACADLMTAMTWPIDMAEELQELDEERDKRTDYTQLTLSHLNYKAALLRPGVMQALFGLVLPPLSKSLKERKERDGQIVNVIFHLIRNLAFIKDPSANLHLSADQAEYSALQTKLVKAMSETHILDLLLTIAANNDQDPLFNASNTLVLEIFYLLYRGIKPSALAIDQIKQPAQNLHRLLAAEDKKKRDMARNASSRHSRFGTTIAVRLNPNRKASSSDQSGENAEAATATNDSQGPLSSRPLLLHRQAAITQESGSVLDIAKQQRAKKTHKVDELTREDNLSAEARIVLQGFAREFVESCFNSFLSSLLKDIKSERAKISEKDHLRLLYTTKWLLDFFLTSRLSEHIVDGQRKWNLGLVAEVTDRSWIVWVLRRMREAMEEKPKMWNELQAGIECLTQLLLLIDTMSSSVISDPDLTQAARLLQQQLIYNGDVLDIAFDNLRSFKEGTQSLAYLNASVYLAYALLRMLERWGKENSGAVVTRVQGNDPTEGEAVPDVEDEGGAEDIEEVIHETMFTFEAFEMKFAHSEITRTLLMYLSRHKDFDSSEMMKRVVNLIHRQAVKAKAEGLYFNVSTLNLFKSILDEQKSLPRDQAYKDLVQLINFILRKFFKALGDESFLAIEAFFPMNRGHWKQFSSWEPAQKSNLKRETTEDQSFSEEVQIKKGYSWSEQIGISVAALVEEGRSELVDWVKKILVLVIRQRQRVVEGTDQHDRGDDADDLDDIPGSAEPSREAISKFADYLIPYIRDEHADAATRNPRLKLMFRLLDFVSEEGTDELQWVVPAAIIPGILQSRLSVIEQFLKNPIDLDGKKASQLLSRKTRRSRRRRSPSPTPDVEPLDSEPRRRKERRKKEEKLYKSAQFIEDSDEEYGDMDAFLEREKGLRERAAKAAAESGRVTTMRANGTKKHRKKAQDTSRSGAEDVSDAVPDVIVGGFDSASNSNDEIFKSLRSGRSLSPPPQAKSRPRPRLVQKSKRKSPSNDASETINVFSNSDEESQDVPKTTSTRPSRGRIILSDDEEL
ncbi:timeless protein-domain-containing protein [Phlebopus sp. FC_14]|nr:timeless protein-domain-containing protein [Phlebopus sp. FC_14]